MLGADVVYGCSTARATAHHAGGNVCRVVVSCCDVCEIFSWNGIRYSYREEKQKKVEVYWNYVCVTVAHQESNKKRL